MPDFNFIKLHNCIEFRIIATEYKKLTKISEDYIQGLYTITGIAKDYIENAREIITPDYMSYRNYIEENRQNSKHFKSRNEAETSLS